MATLIGNGAHATDILATREFDRQFFHHKVYEPAHDFTIIGINDPWLRASVSLKLGIADDPWIHPTAHIGPDCDWRYGCHVNYFSSLTRTTLGCHVTVSPGVTICGDVAIGDRCLIGAGAVICDRVTIGNDVTIGAGAIILPESVIEDGATYVGNPARRIK